MSSEVETSREITLWLHRGISRLRYARNDKALFCRFFFPNATYMVGDVSPDIHFKNFPTIAS